MEDIIMNQRKMNSVEQEVLDKAVAEFKSNLSAFLKRKGNTDLNPLNLGEYMSFVQEETNRIGKELVKSHIESHDSSEESLEDKGIIYKAKKKES